MLVVASLRLSGEILTERLDELDESVQDLSVDVQLLSATVDSVGAM